MKKTKIVCTIGLKTEKKEYLSDLIDAGMNVMRLNFSHGDYEEHGARIKTLKALNIEKNTHVAILLDTKGPEIRTGKIDQDDLLLEKGNNLIITTEDIVGNKDKISVTYKDLPKDVEIGGTILLDDGLIGLEIVDKNDTEIFCIIKNSGIINSRRGVNVPGAKLNLPALSEKDKDNLIWGCKQGVDYVAASFIRKKSDVEEVKAILRENGGKYIKIISKIENQEGLDNFDEILKVSHGIMVARGDLGVEIPMEELPLAQKMMVEKTVQASKLVITATQMLDSMINNPRPTRAEIADVANAVFDGTDAVMLSGETSKHNCAYPVEAVETMARICDRVDGEISSTVFDFCPNCIEIEHELTEAIAKGAVETAKIVDAKLLVAVSVGGRTARKLRRYFPKQHILVLTTEEKTARQMSLLKGTSAYVMDDVDNFKELFEEVIEIALNKKLVNKGDKIILTTSSSLEGKGKTDMLKILTA